MGVLSVYCIFVLFIHIFRYTSAGRVSNCGNIAGYRSKRCLSSSEESSRETPEHIFLHSEPTFYTPRQPELPIILKKNQYNILAPHINIYLDNVPEKVETIRLWVIDDNGNTPCDKSKDFAVEDKNINLALNFNNGENKLYASLLFQREKELLQCSKKLIFEEKDYSYEGSDTSASSTWVNYCLKTSCTVSINWQFKCDDNVNIGPEDNVDGNRNPRGHGSPKSTTTPRPIPPNHNNKDSDDKTKDQTDVTEDMKTPETTEASVTNNDTNLYYYIAGAVLGLIILLLILVIVLKRSRRKKSVVKPISDKKTPKSKDTRSDNCANELLYAELDLDSLPQGDRKPVVEETPYAEIMTNHRTVVYVQESDSRYSNLQNSPYANIQIK